MAVKVENCVPKTQAQLLKMLESAAFETASLINIGLYTIFILQDLTLADSFNFDPKIIEKIDRIFLWIFAVEILLKTFASNGTYLSDKFNAFDAAIVFISVAFNMRGLKAKGLGVLRLLRVVVITIRKITGNTSKLRHQSKINNPIESVIQILNQLHDLPEISNSIKKEARFAINIIESNKLYDLNMDINSEEKNLDVEAKSWLNITTESANDTTLWFERDLDDFLKELHRENEELD